MEYVCGEVLFPGLQNFLLKGDLRYYPAKEKWLQLIEKTTIFIAAPQQIQIVFFSDFLFGNDVPGFISFLTGNEKNGGIQARLGQFSNDAVALHPVFKLRVWNKGRDEGEDGIIV